MAIVRGLDGRSRTGSCVSQGGDDLEASGGQNDMVGNSLFLAGRE